MAEDNPNPPRIPAHLPNPHRDEPGEVAKRVATLEEQMELLGQWIDALLTAHPELHETNIRFPYTAPDPLADPPKMLRGRDRGTR